MSPEKKVKSTKETNTKNIRNSVYVRVTVLKALFVGMYSFLTHGHFISLRNSFLVSNHTMKTLTKQKSIVWSELKYV